MRTRPRPLQRRGGIAALVSCLIAVAIAPASVAEGAIGTPVDLGSGEASNTSTSLSITTSAGAPAGASIIVTSMSESSTTPTAASCSDGAGNGYATDATRQFSAQAIIAVCSTHQIAAALPSGSTVTASWSGGSGTSNKRIRAFAVTGLAAAALDRTASAQGTSGAPSSGVASPTTQPDELLVGAIYDEGHSAAAAGFTPGTNATANNCAATGTPTYTAPAGVGSTAPSLFAIHCTVSATGSYAAQGTFVSGAAFWEAVLATYKSAPASNQPGPAPSGGSPQPGVDPACDRLRKKLARQKRGLEKAVSEAKRSQIQRNIEDTRRRLSRLGC